MTARINHPQIDLLQKYPSLSQLDSLMEVLTRNDNISDHWIIDRKKFENITYRQYKFILLLEREKNYTRRNGLNKVLESLGCQRVDNNTAPW